MIAKKCSFIVNIMKLLSNPLVVGIMAAVITALVLFVYSTIFASGSKMVQVSQDPNDPDSPQIEARVPSDNMSPLFIAGGALFAGVLSGSLASMALSDSGNDFDIEEILDEQF
jgi:hypothetical protein